MADPPPRPPDRRLGLVAPLSVAAVGAILLGMLVARRPPPPPAAAPPVAPATPAPKAPEPPPKPLDRAGVLQVAAEAAAAYAAGVVTPAGDPPLVGRAFVLRVPFGCEGPQTRPGSAQAFYELDADRRTARLVARPAAWSDLPMIRQSPDADRLDAVEGFWVSRPWSARETCPPPARPSPVPAAPTAPASETVGLAQLFSAEDSRVAQRRARPYEFVRKLTSDDALPGPAGFRLVLEGRMAAFPDGRPAHCWSESADHRPVCLLAITLDRVAFEDGADGRLITEWVE